MASEDPAAPATDVDAGLAADSPRVDADAVPLVQGGDGDGAGSSDVVARTVEVDGAGSSDVVTRTVEVDAAPGDVWRAVADPGERSLWLDDPDAVARHMRVDESAPGHRLVWTWWRPGDEGDASTVSVVLSPVDGGGTRVVVTETLPAAPVVRASASASARPAATVPAAAALRRAPGPRQGRHRLWRSRLLGLELLFVAASVAVA